MSRSRFPILVLGIPGLLAYALLVVAQARGGVALAEFKRLEKADPSDSMRPADPGVARRKFDSLARAARFGPTDPDPPFRSALLHLTAAETRSFFPQGPPRALGDGPDPAVASLLQAGLRSARRSLARNPGAAETHFAAALLIQNLAGTGVPDVDETTLAKAVDYHLESSDRLDPRKPSLHYRLGSFWMALGERENARRAFSVSLAGDYDHINDIFATLWSSVEDPEEMGELIGSEPRARVLLGEFLFRRGYLEAARTEYEKALAASPSDFETNLGLVQYFIRAKEFDRALRLIDQMVKRGRDWMPYQRAALEYHRGRILYLTGRYDTAIASYRRSLEIDDSPDHVHHELALAYLKVGETARAVARWRYLLDSRAGSPYVQKNLRVLYRGLASAYEARQEYHQALEEYLRLAELEPGDVALSRKIAEISRKL